MVAVRMENGPEIPSERFGRSGWALERGQLRGSVRARDEVGAAGRGAAEGLRRRCPRWPASARGLERPPRKFEASLEIFGGQETRHPGGKRRL
jgi:hypothetical protein